MLNKTAMGFEVFVLRDRTLPKFPTHYSVLPIEQCTDATGRTRRIVNLVWLRLSNLLGPIATAF